MIKASNSKEAETLEGRTVTQGTHVPSQPKFKFAREVTIADKLLAKFQAEVEAYNGRDANEDKVMTTSSRLSLNRP